MKTLWIVIVVLIVVGAGVAVMGLQTSSQQTQAAQTLRRKFDDEYRSYFFPKGLMNLEVAHWDGERSQPEDLHAGAKRWSMAAGFGMGLLVSAVALGFVAKSIAKEKRVETKSPTGT